MFPLLYLLFKKKSATPGLLLPAGEGRGWPRAQKSGSSADTFGAVKHNYYAAVNLGDVAVGFAWLSDLELNLFNSRQCAFGRSIRVRPLRYSDFLQPFPPYRAWHHVQLAPSLLDAYHAGSVGWWHVTRDTAKALAFGCTPALVHDERGATLDL